MLYENQHSTDQYTEPTELVDEIEAILEKVCVSRDNFLQNKLKIFHFKNEIPIRQLFALYAINKISTVANSK